MSYNNLFSLVDKTIIIAGGSGQIGYELAKGCYHFGAKVLIADLDDQNASRKLDDDKISDIEVLHLDVSCPESVVTFCSSLNQNIDGLVNCFHYKGDTRKLDKNSNFFDNFTNYPVDAWDQVHNVNLRGTFILSQGLIPLFNKGGAIVNVSSTYGIVSADKSIYGDSGINSPVAYASSKSAILNLTRYMANHIEGIRVNSLSPGGVFNNQNKEFIEKYSEKTTLGRMAFENEYVGPIIFLLSKASSYMTGSNLIVDGGWTSK